MFTLSMSYETGFLVHIALAGIVLAAYYAHVLYCWSYNFIRDINAWGGAGAKKPFRFWFAAKYPANEEYFLFYPLLYSGVALIGSGLWPILWPVAGFVALAIGARKVFRFKRKVTDILGSKADKDHTHTEEDKDIVIPKFVQ